MRKIFLIVLFSIITISCEKENPVNCENEIELKTVSKLVSYELHKRFNIVPQEVFGNDIILIKSGEVSRFTGLNDYYIRDIFVYKKTLNAFIPSESGKIYKKIVYYIEETDKDYYGQVIYVEQ